LGILTFSSHGRVEFINQNFHKLGLLYQFNTSLLNINIFKYNLFPPINIIEELKAVVKGRPFEKEIKHIKTDDGRMISLIVKGSAVYEEENISGGMLLIEDLQFSSETGEESPGRLTDDYINRGDIFFIVTDTSGDIKYSAGKEIQGSNLLRREITGRSVNEIFSPPIKEKVIESFNNAVEIGKAQFLQIEFILNDITKKFDCSIEPVIGENGFVQVIYLVFKESPLPPAEISSMVEKLKKLEYYKAISRKRDTGLLLFNNSGDIIDWDEQFEIISGVERTEKSLSASELFPSIHREELLNIIRQLDDKNSCELTTYLENRSKGKLPVHLNFYKSMEGGYQIIVVCDRIILNSPIIKQAERKTVAITEEIEPSVQITSGNIYQSMFKAASDGIAVELDERITLANDSFAKIFGYKDAKELEGKNLLELVSEDSVSVVTQYLNNKRTSKPGRERLDFIARKKDGLIFYAEFCAFELKENNQLHLVLIVKDVSEKKRMQEAAKDSEQKYRNIAENIDDLLYTFERFEGKMFPTYYSKAIEKISGYTQTEFLSDQRLFLKIIHPDDFRDLKKRLSFLWKSDAQITSEFEFRIINKSGNVVWVRNKINVVRNSDGNIQKVYGLISDITFNKRAEEELKQSAANLKKLNDAKDRFLSIISHDLRAPFSSILGFTDLLLEDDTLTDVEKHQYIVYIQDSSKSMLALVNSMLDWTRLQTGRIKFEPEKLNAREIIESSIVSVSGTALKKGVEIENLVEPALHIYGDKNLILQVFNNLLSNAVKFTKLGDRIMISVNVSQTSRFITFSVKDTGIGIKSNNLDKLFSIETKFTSEGTAGEKGSGLGLSLVKDIIEKHGGKIDVNSDFGKGTEFKFTLPVASTKILLIDPNNRERMFYSKVLINITTDYAVNVVSNGKEALERIIQSPPALVITEHKMPIMSGLQLIQELIKNNLLESVPVIVLTAEIERADIQEYTDLGIEYIFNKPVNLINLKAAIEKSLKKRNH
jgi:PAS domain S-box-containing protein